jgi:DUF4097 and DUF4098 domain-containing protein YvlB
MCILLLALILNSAQALEKYTYPVQKISLKGARDIKIVGVRGHLKMRGVAHAKALSLKVQHSKGRKFEDWHLSVERRGKTIFLEVFNTAYGKQWRHEVREDLWPEFDIDLEGAALPTTVGWREGTLKFKNWNSDLEISFLKGSADVSGGTGKLELEPVDAAVRVSGHRGSVNIKGESGGVTLARNQGELALSWLNGNVLLENCRGPMKIETRTADVTVRNGRGELNLQMGRGLAKITNFDGTVQGRGDQAKWDLAARAPADVNITTSTGPVGMQWLNGGAKVFLTSTRGKIEFPPNRFLKSGDREGRRVVEGVRSAKSMGQVFIRTDSGPISWR